MKLRSYIFRIMVFSIIFLFTGFIFVITEHSLLYCDEWGENADDQHKEKLIEKIGKRLEEKQAEFIELYRDLHRHPEVSGKEERTAGIIAEHLKAIGLEVKTGIGGHGIVGILTGAKPGPVIAYRADMDAVFSDEPDPVSFRSETPGVRHICGHDLHVTVALGVAEALASIREELSGTVKFIFQPAEENAQGARDMIADGVLENPAPRAILAVHCAPLEVGQIGSKEGILLAGFDIVDVVFEGEGDLKAAAEAFAKVISDVNTVSLTSSPRDEAESPSTQDLSQDDFIFAVVFSSEENPEKNQWILQAMIRASSEDNFAKAKNDIQTGVENLDLPGVSYKINYMTGVMPSVMNDPALVRGAVDIIRSLLGEEGLVSLQGVPPFFSEDFSLYLQKIPGVMYFLGVSNEEKGIIGLPHHPQFAVDEEAIHIGAITIAAVLLNYLETN